MNIRKDSVRLIRRAGVMVIQRIHFPLRSFSRDLFPTCNTSDPMPYSYFTLHSLLDGGLPASRLRKS